MNTNECRCKDNLVIERKTVSRLVAAGLLLSFFIFISGYFLGKKRAIEHYCQSIERDSFADQIQYSMSSLYDYTAPAGQQDNSELCQIDTSTDERNQLDQEPSQVVAQGATKRYQAQLLGGTSRLTNNFATRLHKRGIDVNVVKRTGKTKTGRIMYWYQVVTNTYADKKELDQIVSLIKQTEKLGDITIVEIS